MFKFFPYFILTPLIFADIFPFQTIEKANQAYENGEFAKSTRLFKSLKKDEPIVAYNQANAQYKTGMYDEALKNYTKAKGIDEAIRQYNIGNTYFKKNDLDKAIASYEKALKIREDEDTRYNLELAKKEREAQNKQKNKDKNKEKKKKDKEKKDEKKKKEKKSQDKKDTQKKAAKKMTQKKKPTKEEKLRKKELSHLIKQLSKKKMPTILYQATDEKGERHDKNPW